jgi:hypothetical protein
MEISFKNMPGISLRRGRVIRRMEDGVLRHIYPEVDTIQWKTVHLAIVLVLPF